MITLNEIQNRMYAVVKLYQDFYNKPCLLINKCDISMQNIRAYMWLYGYEI